MFGLDVYPNRLFVHGVPYLGRLWNTELRIYQFEEMVLLNKCRVIFGTPIYILLSIYVCTVHPIFDVMPNISIILKVRGLQFLRVSTNEVGKAKQIFDVPYCFQVII